MLNIWNVKSSNCQPSISIKVCPYEVLTVDWNKYNGNQLAVGATDGQVYVWDLRNKQQPYMVFNVSYFIRLIKNMLHFLTQNTNINITYIFIKTFNKQYKMLGHKENKQ